MRMKPQIPFAMVGIGRWRVTILAILSGAVLAFIVVSSKSTSTSPTTTTSSSSSEPVGESSSTNTNKRRKRRSVSNRELQASISAHSWPTTPQSPLCEAFAYMDSDPDASSSTSSSQRKLAYLTALTDILLDGTSVNAPYEDGLDMARRAASTTQSSLFDSNMLSYSLATRAHTPLCETYRVLGNAVTRGSPNGTPLRSFVERLPTSTFVDGGLVPPPKVFMVVEGAKDCIASSMDQVMDVIRNYNDRRIEEVEEVVQPAWAKLLPDEVPITPPPNNEDDDPRPTPIVILYGEMGSIEFATFYRHMRKTIPNSPFVVRHLGPIPTPTTTTNNNNKDEQTKTVLQGYGVRVDIRKMEYKSFDDKAGIEADDEGADEDEEEDSDEEEEDSASRQINPAMLHKSTNNDDASNNRIIPLFTPKNKKSTNTNTINPLTDEKRSDLSLQATSIIASSDDPLWTLQQLAQNLPSHAEALSSLDVDPNLKSRARQLRMYSNSFSGSGGGGRMGGGNNAMVEFHVNGRRIAIDQPSFNLFELIAILREENALLASVTKRMGPYASSPKKAARIEGATSHLLTMGKEAFDSHTPPSTEVEGDGEESSPNAAPSSKIRIDVGRGYRGAILYLNDLERDPQYRQWPSRMHDMIMAMQYGQPPTIRRNMLTVVMVVDPLTDGDGSGGDKYIESVGMLIQLMQGGFPVRLGVLFASDDDIDACRLKLASESNTNSDSDDDDKATTATCDVTPAIPSDKRATTHAAFKLFKDVHASYGGMMALHYLYRSLENLKMARESRTYNDIQTPFTLDDLIDSQNFIFEELQIPSQSTTAIRKILNTPDSDGDNVETYANAVKFATERRIKAPMAFVNGIYLPMASSTVDVVHGVIQEEMQYIISLVMGGIVTDAKPRSVYAHMLTGDNVYKALHPLLTDSADNSSDDGDGDEGGGDTYKLLPYGDSNYIVEVKGGNPNGEGGASLLYELVVDLTSESGIDTVISFLTALSQYKLKAIAEDKQLENGTSSPTTALAIAYQVIPSNEQSARSALGSIMRHARFFNDAELFKILKTARGWDSDTMTMTTTIESLKQLFDVQSSQYATITELIKYDECTPTTTNNQGKCPFVPLLSSSDDGDNKSLLLANGRVYRIPQGAVVQLDDIEILAALEQKSAHTIANTLFAGDKNNEDDDNCDEYKRGNTNDKDEDASDCDDYKRTSNYLVVARIAAFLGEQFASSEFESTVRADVITPVERIRREFGATATTGDDDGKNWFYYSWNGDKRDDDNVNRVAQPEVKITAILDPLSEATQRISPILRTIRDDLKLPLTVIIMPRLEIEEGSALPITSYYRFVAGSGSTTEDKAAVFEGLPTNQVLTIRMDVPEPWDVQQSYAVQDTDNLQCDTQSCGDDAYAMALRKNSGGDDDDDDDDDKVSSTKQDGRDLTKVDYQLNNLLFFGRCNDLTSGSPPNGLQLTLSDEVSSMKVDDTVPSSEAEVLPDGSILDTTVDTTTDRSQSDTLVMKTMGYFQLRANPGVWQLQIAKSSRGAEIFDMITQGGPAPTKKLKVSSKTLVMKSFVDRGKSLSVQRKPGFETAELFANDDTTTQEDEETVHVFSLATGHLYERFLKIMMISVTKRTSVKVKFWLFENFLSPSFKASAYAMAKKIGCELEFVTYKWPQWLRGQNEKQRIIWGYKILFLDVLFPLNLKKVIYVDADQVVRGDLKELWDLDLQGAPYGYTPFCQSREETLGYQFWRDGFWTNHLKGKPYHISALYVVDLERFRRELVGDKLRSLYQQLSSDPNNLSNLDQDLPNYAQYMVKIHSLPQDWLWCETWCSDETKATAKTIDLCNNPEHKEPKVSMAKRIISGDLFDESWIELDAEVDLYENEYLNSAV